MGEAKRGRAGMETAKPNGGWSWSDERVGDALAVAAGLGFLLVCMFLPLVGPAAARGSGSPGASRAPYYALSYATFLIVLLLTFALGAGAAGSKVLRRRDVGGGLPWVSLGLCGACFVLLVALLAGALQV